MKAKEWKKAKERRKDGQWKYVLEKAERKSEEERVKERYKTDCVWERERERKRRKERKKRRRRKRREKIKRKKKNFKIENDESKERPQRVER